MAVISIVKLSEFEKARRIDAEYYQPEYLEVEKQLLRTKFVYFKDLVKEIIHPKEIKREYEEEKKDYLFLLAQNVRPLMLDLSERKYISEEKAKLLSKNKLENGDILFVRSGNVGDVAVYFGKPENVISSADLLIAKPNSNFKYPFYIGIFLNTKMGKTLLLRGVYSGLQPHIAPSYLHAIIIPLFPENFIKEVEKLFFQAQELLFKSENLYSQAESILLSELGLQDFKPKDELYYKVDLSEASKTNRIDAEYFNPSYEEILERVQNYKNGYGKLLDFVESVKPKFDPQKYPQRTFLYVELADINVSIGVIESSTNITGEEAPSRAKRILKKDDVIVSRVEGSIEKVALVDEQFEGSIASTGFFQFRSKSILPEVLLVLAKSIIIQTQLKRECTGTILTAVPEKAVEKIMIPILTLKTQQEIAKLVQESHEARKKAKQLLDKAKSEVEYAIKNHVF